MDQIPHCALCAGKFRNHGGTHPPPGPVHWTTLARSVHGSDGLDEATVPQITGLGFVTQDRVAARMGYQTSYADATGEAAIRPQDLLFPLQGLRHFSIHEFCWHFLLCRIKAESGNEPDPRRIASLLFHVLHSLPWARNGALVPDHGYFGALNLRQTVEGISDLMADPDQPVPILEVGRSLVELGEDFVSPNMVQHYNPSSNCGHFERFPDELIAHIFTLLPSQDVCSLRLSCPRLAALAAPSNLPQNFWASRFLHNREMGFLSFWNNSSDMRHRNWMAAYHDCKSTLEDSAAKGLHNRRRIWHCLEDFSTIVRAMLQINDSPSPSLNQIARVFPFGERVSCPELPNNFNSQEPFGQHISLGTRLRKEFLVFLDSDNDSDTTLIEISSISLVCGEFISGIRLSVQEEDDPPSVISQCGWISPSNLTSITIEPGDEILSIDVFISTSGIHCLKFFIEKDDGQTFVHSAGNARYPAGLVATTRLVPQSTIEGFVIGFDLYKAVSIQLVETPGLRQDDPKLPVLWSPQIPSMLGPDESGQPSLPPSFTINLHIPLGGPDDSRLSSLRSITAYFYGRRGIYGLELAYMEGDSVLYGTKETRGPGGERQNCVAQTFSIDGPNDERIMLLSPGFLQSNTAVVGNIQVWTNLGRHYTFGAFNVPEVRYGEVIQNRGPIRALLVAVQPSTLVSIAITPGSGFYARPDMVHACPWMQQTEGPCCTTASLKHIRCIRISMGTGCGSSRSKNHISGLWIEYEGALRDVVVGQWMEERTSFQLNPDEEVLEIAVWNTMDVQLSRSIERFGKVVGIAFTTTQGKFELRLPQHAGVAQTYIRYHATTFEDLDSMTWVFCESMDDIQVRMKASALLSPKMLVMAHSTRVERPLDLAEGVTRFYLHPPSPTFDPAVAHYVEAAMRYDFTRETFFFQNADENKSLSGVKRVDFSANWHGNLTGIAFHYYNRRSIRQGTISDNQFSIHLDRHRGEAFSVLVVFSMLGHGKGLQVRQLFPPSQDKSSETIALTHIRFQIQTTLGRRTTVVSHNIPIRSVAVFSLLPDVQLPSAESLGCRQEQVTYYEFPNVGPGTDRCVGIWAVSRSHRPASAIEDVVDVMSFMAHEL
ncbi:unnamed protein product [Clonostachys rosea]|uniref:F-box domain-containing protein n=1 Tax=Bionectria ochroleuca TaxID=29856 RepID=A0ABY6V016_BIOOC|nr:unnamed protein product [Clonostachys rosea]